MNWLKWSLGIVVLAFIIFYIPDFLRDEAADAASGDVVASVEGTNITGTELRRIYSAQLEAYRTTYGASMSEELLRQLGIEQQIVQQMVDERAALAEAGRLGVRVSDAEVRQRIMSYPAFLENGVFIGEARYVQLLRAQRPPTSPAEFESAIRQQLTLDKLRASLTDWLSMPDSEVDQEYRRRNDKVKVALVAFTAEAFKNQVAPTDAEISVYFDAHKDDFKIPEKRKIRYALIDVDQLRKAITIPPADVERAYNENIDQYKTPEQVRASHILLKTDGKDDAAVKAEAEKILAEAKAPNADFAALARKYSEDEGSKANGGDLDYFSQGQMVPEFDQAAFSMQPGQISGLVKTQFGYHIIKVTDRKAGSTRPLDEVRPQIVDQLSYERATTQAAELSQKLASQVSKPEDLDTIAKANNLTVQESNFFARDEAIVPLGPAPEAASRAFDLKEGEAAGPLRTPRGFVFEALVSKQDPYVPPLAEVKEKVRETVATEQAKALSKARAAEIGAKLKAGADFEKTAAAAGLQAATSDLIVRGTPLPEIGVAPEVEEAAFSMAVGAVSDPIATGQGSVVVKVLEKQEIAPDQLALSRDRFRDELLTDRKNRFFAAYMAKAKQKMKISINQDAVQRVMGT
ncbi:MAG: peptidyl-prolyl cis-trans isomerase [Acidobacteria bacterium]|nr:peptidyl-prolyl cis-trans isomerase [Acidobacteriota bacterium]